MPILISLNLPWISTTYPWLANSTIWLKLHNPTSCMPRTNSQSTLQTLGNRMEKQLAILFVIWKRLVTLEPVFDLVVQKVLNAIATPTSLELGTSNLLITTQAQQNLEAVGLSSMQTIQSFGHQSCRPRLLFPRPKLNTFPCLNPCKISFPSCFLFKRWRAKVFKLFALKPTFTVKSSKTIQVHWNLLGFPSFVLVPNISTYAIIIYVSTCRMALSRSFQSVPRTRLLTP